MKNWISISILSAVVGLFLGASQALAVGAPNFPSCANPQGTVFVPSNDGVHGIAGDTIQYTGSDTVYQLDPSTLQQCFCSASGQGIQTNWWKISSLDQDELKVLESEGWIYVPNGALWGLQETPYMAMNSSYACLGNSNNNNNNNSSSNYDPQSDGKSDGKSDGQGCGNHDCNTHPGATQIVLGVSTGPSTDVLGLASTGGSNLPYILAIVGGVVFLLGVALNIKSSK